MSDFWCEWYDRIRAAYEMGYRDCERNRKRNPDRSVNRVGIDRYDIAAKALLLRCDDVLASVQGHGCPPSEDSVATLREEIRAIAQRASRKSEADNSKAPVCDYVTDTGAYRCTLPQGHTEWHKVEPNHSQRLTEPECPGPDCKACNGEACDLCGAGKTGFHGRCDHDVLQRHQEPPHA